MLRAKTLSNIGNLPDWVYPSFEQCLEKLDDEISFLHLAMRGLEKLDTHVRLLEVLDEADRRTDGQESQSCVTEALDHARSLRTQSQIEASSGFSLLHVHSTAAIWSAVEVLCEDLLVDWLLQEPDAWTEPRISAVKIQVGTWSSLSKEEQARYVVHELEHSACKPSASGSTRLLSLLSHFSLNPKLGPNARKALHELWQVRNVILHRGSRADRKIIEECPWLGLELGQLLEIPHPVYNWYYRASYCFTERLFNETLRYFGKPFCECPGTDEIDERPTADSVFEDE